jgi:hypothetical protein
MRTQTHAQTDSAFIFSNAIKGSFTNFTVDNLGNIYLFTSTNQLKKVNSKGDSLAVFNDVKRFGKATQIDVSNPLKILLYYKNFATIIVLDRFLNQRNTISLRKQNIFSVNSIATSYDNNIWLYDEQEYKLKKIDDDGKILQESNDLRMTFDSIPSAVQLTDRNTYIYLYDSTKGFYAFDYYFSFKNRMTFTQWQNTGVTDASVFGFKNNKLLHYQLQSLKIKEYQLPNIFGNYKVIKAVNNKVYLLKNEGIYVYTVR